MQTRKKQDHYLSGYHKVLRMKWHSFQTSKAHFVFATLGCCSSVFFHLHITTYWVDVLTTYIQFEIFIRQIWMICRLVVSVYVCGFMPVAMWLIAEVLKLNLWYSGFTITIMTYLADQNSYSSWHLASFHLIMHKDFFFST